MRKILTSIFLASATFFLASCGSSGEKDDKKSENESTTTIMSGTDIQYTELAKMPLPCTKEALYTAWKQIGVIEGIRKKPLDYKQNTPKLFLSTDLDGDGNCEILLRSDPPYAAIFAYVNDTLQIVTFVNKPEIGLSITPDGVIMQTSTDHNGSITSQFIRLKDSQAETSGESCETFAVEGGAMVSKGMKYRLKSGSEMVEVSKEAYLQVAPRQEGTFLEDIDGWEDFRKP